LGKENYEIRERHEKASQPFVQRRELQAMVTPVDSPKEKTCAIIIALQSSA
jgi:hypothetical protein